MNMFKIIIKSTFSPIDIIKSEETRENLLASVIVVLAASVFGSIIAPAAYYLYNRNKFEISLSIGSMLIMLLLSILTWLVTCTLFWIISLLFKKNLEFNKIAASWGLSYIPNLICIVAYSIIEMSFVSFIISSFVGVLINTFFIMLLVWKTLYYFLEMKYVLKLNALELFITTIITAVVFLVLMSIGFSAGIQIPML